MRIFIFVFLIGSFFVYEKERSTQDLDPNLIGVWVMVKSEKDGRKFPDISIEKKYTYSFQKNGDYIFDFRIVREQTQIFNMSITEFPRLKWSTRNNSIFLKALNNKGEELGVHVDGYFFLGDTLVKENSGIKTFYLKINEK